MYHNNHQCSKQNDIVRPDQFPNPSKNDDGLDYIQVTVIRMLLLLSLVLLTAAVVAWIPRINLIEQFKEYETAEETRNLQILIYALDSELDGLQNLAYDWSTWDASYRFMQDHNQAFLKENINWQVISKTSRIDLIYFREQNGLFIWGSQNNNSSSTYDYTVADMDPELVSYFSQIKGSKYKGILLTRKRGPILISAAPVYPISRPGESRGMLIMGRYLDNDLLKELSKHNQMDIELHDNIKTHFSTSEQKVLEKLRRHPGQPQESDGVNTRNYILMKDLRGQEFLVSYRISHAQLQRGIQAANTVYAAILGAVLITLVVGVILFLISARQVSKKRQQLEEELTLRTVELRKSEERYSKLIEEAEDGIFIYDLNFILRDINAQAFKRLHYPRGDVIGKEVFRFLPPEYHENTRRQTAKVVKTGFSQYESLHLRSDGTTVPVEVSSQLIEFDGDPCVLTISRDISARKQAEEARMASERLYRIIFENTPVGVVYIDSELRVIRANQSMGVIVNMDRLADFYGKQITSQEIGDELMDCLQRARNGEACTFEGEYKPPLEEDKLTMRILFSPVDAEHSPTDIICIVEDISARKRDEAQLRQLYTAIEQTPLSIVITDIKGSIKFVNKTFEKVTGFGAEEVMGRDPSFLDSGTMPPEIYGDLWTTILNGKVWKGQLHSRTKQGNLFWLETEIAPVMDKDGQITNFVAVKKEITVEKLMDEAASFVRELALLEEPLVSVFGKILREGLRLTASSFGVVAVRYRSNYNYDLWCMMDADGSNSIQIKDSNIDFNREPYKTCVEQGLTSVYEDIAPDDFKNIPAGFEVIERMIVIPIKGLSDKTDVIVAMANKTTAYTENDIGISTFFMNNAWNAIQRRQTETALRETQQRAKAVFEAVQTGIVLVDARSNRIVDANPTALQMYGGSIDEIKGLWSGELFSRADTTDDLISGDLQELESSDWILISKDGTRTPILRTVARVTENEKDFLLASFVDLTERKNMEEELRNAKNAAEAAYKAKSMFLANMSHEIRTPMNAIMGYAQLIKRDSNLSENQRRNLDIIENSGNYLLTIINDILEMARIEAGHIRLNEENCDFGRLLDDVEDIFRLLCREKGLLLMIERANLLEASLKMDVGKVRQVLINLIGNALKFTDEGGIAVRISQVMEPVMCADEEPAAGIQVQYLMKVEVEDTGHGIPADKTESVFEVFEQAHAHGKTAGTGLGLAISRNFARSMGGDLELIRSEIDKGSLFRFTFVAYPGGGVIVTENPSDYSDVKAVDSGREVSPDLITAMRESVENGDMQQMENILRTFEEQDRLLADRLRNLAERYDYDGLFKYLDILMQNMGIS